MTFIPAAATAVSRSLRLRKIKPRRGTPGLTMLALATGGFGIGLSQGGAASVIQSQVTDLGTSVEALGYTMVAYALGVVVGAPLIMVGMGRVDRRPLLLGLSAIFVVTTVATLAAPNVQSLFAVRFIAGFPHGAFLGTAAYVGMTLLGKERRGKAVATIMFGLTLSSVFGVAGMQWISVGLDWRAAYMVVAVVGLVAFAALWLMLPSIPGNASTSFSLELRSLSGAPVWTAIAMTTIGFAGLGAVFSYIVPLLEETNGFSSSAVTMILVVWGVGLTIGAWIGGRVTDASPVRAARVGLAATALMLLGLGLLGDKRLWVVVFLLLLAAAVQVVSQSAQTHLMDVIPQSPSLGAATSHAALNAANALGGGLGAVVIGFGWGYVAPAWVALVLTVAGLAIALRGPGFRARPAP